MSHLHEASDLKGIGTSQVEFEISASNFRDLKLFLSKIRMHFNDLSINNGSFRTHSNDHSCVVETGFNSLRDTSINIFNIKSFLKSINTFKRSDKISIKISQNNIIFSDSEFELSFVNHDPNHADNKFITDADMGKRILKNICSEKLILRSAIPKELVRKMRTVTRSLLSTCIRLEHDPEDLHKGILVILGKSDDSIEYQFKIDRSLQIPMKANHYLELPLLPFYFNSDDIYYSCYFTDDDNVAVFFNTNLNNLYVNIYSQSKFINKRKEN